MNVLIVESENDEFFVTALINKMEQNSTVVSIDEFKHSPLDEKGKELTIQIESILSQYSKVGIDKIGIILDLDDATKQDRIDLVNKCFRNAYNDADFEEELPVEFAIKEVNELTKVKIDEYSSVEIACYFVNVGKEGELETVLRAIKTVDSPFADCLYEGWKVCFEGKGKKLVGRGEKGDISHKDLLKVWADFYKRFDTLGRNSRNEKTTDWKGICTGETQPDRTGRTKQVKARINDIYDLEHSLLDDLKKFLKLFK